MTSLPAVFVIGDSISMQYGPYLEAGLAGSWRYFRKTGKDTGNLDIPEGANGGDSSMVRDYLRAWREHGGFKPDLLLVNCGLHDIKTNVASGKVQIPLEQYRENLAEIIHLAREISGAFIWVRSTHISDAIHNSRGIEFNRFAADGEAYNAAADEVMTQAGVPMIDLNRFTHSLGSDEELFCDHAHFQESVRQRQGAFIAGWLIGWRQACG